MNRTPKTKIKKYPNGATLYYVENLSNRTTEYQVGYICGADKDKIHGTAHYLEHILAGTYVGITKKEYQSFCAENTIMKNAMTSKNTLTLYIDCPTSKFTECFDVSSRMLFNREFSDKLIESERNAIIEEYYMTHDEENTWQTIAMQNDFEDLCNGTKILGNEADIRSIKKETLLEYAEENFVSENLFCAVCSDLPFEEIEKQFEAKFVNLSKSDETKKNTAIPYKRIKNTNRFFISEAPNQKTNEIKTSMYVKLDEDSTAFVNFVHFVFNTKQVFLNKLREDRGLVYSAHFGIENDYDRSGFYYNFNMSTSKNKINECIDVLAKLFNSFKRRGVLQDTYNQFQNYCTSCLDRLEKSKKVSIASQITNLIMGKGFSISSEKQTLEACKALTFDQVNNFMKTVFINPTLEFTLTGDFDRSKIYSVQAIQNKLGSERTNIVDLKHRGDFYLTKNDKMVLLNDEERLANAQQITEIFETKKLNYRNQHTVFRGTFFKVIGKDVFHYDYKANSTFVELENGNLFVLENDKLTIFDYQTGVYISYENGNLVFTSEDGEEVDFTDIDMEKVCGSNECILIATVGAIKEGIETSYAQDTIDALMNKYNYYLQKLKQHKKASKQEIYNQQREYFYEDKIITNTKNGYTISVCPVTNEKALEDPLHNIYFKGQSNKIEFETKDGGMYFYDDEMGVCYDTGYGTIYPFDENEVEIKEDELSSNNVGVAVLLLLNNQSLDDYALKQEEIETAKKVVVMIKNILENKKIKTSTPKLPAKEINKISNIVENADANNDENESNK